MKAIVYDKAKEFELRDIEKPVIAANEVLVKVDCCGICKTDVHQHNGSFIVEFPLIPGHEAAGTVVEIGSGVSDVCVGDRVTVDDTGQCGTCHFCQNDMPLFCSNFSSKGSNRPGAFAEYIAVDFDKVFKLADHVSFEEGCFSEPTACAIHGLDVIAVKPGEHVLLFGAGSTGIILAQLLNSSGAGSVTVAAPSKDKLDLLNELGIKHTYQISRDDAESNRALIMQNQPHGYDVVVDATGSAKVVEEGFKYLKKNGRMILYAVYNEDARVSISPYDFFANQFHVTGSFAQYHCFPRAVNAINEGIVKVDRLVTKVLPIEKFEEGLTLAEKGGPGSIKVLIKL